MHKITTKKCLFSLGILVTIITSLTVPSGAQTSTAKKENPAMGEAKQWFPYIVPEGYVKDLSSVSDAGIIRAVGHKLYLELVIDLHGMVRNVTLEDLKKANITAKAAYTQAYSNLEGLLKANQIQMTAYPKGPNNAPFIVVSDHWCSAACILLPGIYELAKKGLHSERIVAIIPHRDVLLLFPMPDKQEGLNRLRDFAKEKEGDGRKPLSFEPFELTKTGPIASK